MEELLLLVKSKGFQPKTFSTMWTFRGIIGEGKNFLINKECESNLLNEIQKWLREVHDIIVEVNYSDCEFWQWIIFYKRLNIHYLGTNEKDDVDLSYEQILEIGLQEALKLIN